MELWGIIVPFIWLVLIESIAVRWIAASPIPNLISRIIAVNVTGIVLLLVVSMAGWHLGIWPDIRNWALRDNFFLFLVVKIPTFWFLFRRWGTQKIFTLHVLSNYASAMVLSLLFIYSPIVIGIRPVTIEQLNNSAKDRLYEIRDALESYKTTYGHYPKYIYGGDQVSWGMTGGAPSPDPLLNEGYLTAYPVNPFHLRKTYFEPRRSPGLQALWLGTKSESFLHLRNILWLPVVDTEPRFGFRGNKMGNILPDPDVPASEMHYGDIEIHMTIQGHWLPGGFIYRSYDFNEDNYADAYILGVCTIENAQATIDCYDARTDSLLTVYSGLVKPLARDGIRDGINIITHRGFPSFEEQAQEIAAGDLAEDSPDPEPDQDDIEDALEPSTAPLERGII